MTGAASRTLTVLGASALGLAGALAVTAADASAASVSSGPRTLSVSATDGLSPSGQTVTVSGSGYDVNKGIYIAFCVRPAAGQLPSPCGGGADLSGTSGGSIWISSNPPPYGATLAKPYGAGGTFSVALAVSPTIGDVDCRVTQCAVVTRNDHTRGSDRSQDVVVPVSFAVAGSGAQQAEGRTEPAAPAPPPATQAPAPPPPATAVPAPPAPGNAGGPGSTLPAAPQNNGAPGVGAPGVGAPTGPAAPDSAGSTSSDELPAPTDVPTDGADAPAQGGVTAADTVAAVGPATDGGGGGGLALPLGLGLGAAAVAGVGAGAGLTIRRRRRHADGV